MCDVPAGLKVLGGDVRFGEGRRALVNLYLLLGCISANNIVSSISLSVGQEIGASRRLDRVLSKVSMAEVKVSIEG